MLFTQKNPKIDRGAQLAARPARLLEPASTHRADGGINLAVPLGQTSFAFRLFRAPAGATKTFELDEIGAMVWDAIDGRTSVQQIIRKLAKRYHLSLREAEVATLAFLRTLTRKGLIAMQLKQSK